VRDIWTRGRRWARPATRHKRSLKNGARKFGRSMIEVRARGSNDEKMKKQVRGDVGGARDQERNQSGVGSRNGARPPFISISRK
jgi:hypothetical protein